MNGIPGPPASGIITALIGPQGFGSRFMRDPDVLKPSTNEPRIGSIFASPRGQASGD